MKLYIEEKIIETFSTGVLSLYKGYIKERLETLTPIELPSDEEIEKEVKLIEPYATNDYCDGFSDGINWYKNLIGRNIKEQILNQNK